MQSVAWQSLPAALCLVEDMQLGTTNRRRLCGTPFFSFTNTNLGGKSEGLEIWQKCLISKTCPTGTV
jgi:hypothetical protein